MCHCSEAAEKSDEKTTEIKIIGCAFVEAELSRDPKQDVSITGPIDKYEGEKATVTTVFQPTRVAVC